MIIDVPLLQGLSLKIGEPLQDRKDYPTGRLQKGFILLDHGEPLTEEAVGFGVPVLKRGLQAIFPGDVTLNSRKSGTTWEVTAVFKLNLVEKISGNNNVNIGNKPFYAIKDILADGIRRFPIFRGLLTGTSSWLRRIFNLKTTYTEGGPSTSVKVVYTLDTLTGNTRVEVDPASLPADITELVMMNEQGAHFFDRYQDSSGKTLQGDEIGCWDQIFAEEAWFESSSRRVAFRLGQAEGGRLFCGRELIGSRLAWAGFGYSFSPAGQKLKYEMIIQRLA